MKAMVELCIFVHEVVHARIRAHSNSFGDGIHQVFTPADMLSEGFAGCGMVEVLEMYAGLQIQNGGLDAQGKACVDALLEVAGEFERLRPILGLDSNIEYVQQMGEVAAEKREGKSLSRIYAERVSAGEAVVTSITAAHLTAVESMDGLRKIQSDAEEAMREGRYPEAEVAALLSTLAYAEDAAVKTAADDALIGLYALSGKGIGAAGVKAYADEIKKTASDMFAFRPGQDG